MPGTGAKYTVSSRMDLIDVDVQGLRRKIASLKKALGNMKPVFEEIGEELRASVMENFKAEGRPHKWEALSPVTLALKKKNKDKILIESGHLRNSINYKATARDVTIGTSGVQYASIHQFGGQAGRSRKVTIPARPYLVIQPEDIERMEIIVDDYLAKAGK